MGLALKRSAGNCAQLVSVRGIASQVGLPVVDLNEVGLLDAYVDGADRDKC